MTNLLRTILVLSTCCIFSGAFAQSTPIIPLEIAGRKMKIFKIDLATLQLVRDSMFEVKLPKRLWGVDTTTTINPVTMVEETAIINTTTSNLHGYLGEFSRPELKAAFTDKLGIEKAGNYNVESFSLTFIGDSTRMTINFDRPDQLQQLSNKLDKLPTNSLILLGNLMITEKGDGNKLNWERNAVAFRIEE